MWFWKWVGIVSQNIKRIVHKHCLLVDKVVSLFGYKVYTSETTVHFTSEQINQWSMVDLSVMDRKVMGRYHKICSNSLESESAKLTLV
jgi:hypothetical protein